MPADLCTFHIDFRTWQVSIVRKRFSQGTKSSSSTSSEADVSVGGATRRRRSIQTWDDHPCTTWGELVKNWFPINWLWKSTNSQYVGQCNPTSYHIIINQQGFEHCSCQHWLFTSITGWLIGYTDKIHMFHCWVGTKGFPIMKMHRV